MDELRTGLLKLTELEAPVQVRPEGTQDLIAEWKLADARWTTLFEKAGLSVAHTVRMGFNAKQRVVRTIDTQRRLRWSAGAPRLSRSLTVHRYTM